MPVGDFVTLIENKPYTEYPSDNIEYLTPQGMVKIDNPALRSYKFFKKVYRRYKAGYRYYGRFMVFVSNDRKHWINVFDQLVAK